MRADRRGDGTFDLGGEPGDDLFDHGVALARAPVEDEMRR